MNEFLRGLRIETNPALPPERMLLYAPLAADDPLPESLERVVAEGRVVLAINIGASTKGKP